MQKQSPKTTTTTETPSQNRADRQAKKPRRQTKRARDTKQRAKHNHKNKGARKAKKKAKPHDKQQKKPPPRYAKRHNTMKNTSLGVWGAAMSGPKKTLRPCRRPRGCGGRVVPHPARGAGAKPRARHPQTPPMIISLEGICGAVADKKCAP